MSAAQKTVSEVEEARIVESSLEESKRKGDRIGSVPGVQRLQSTQQDNEPCNNGRICMSGKPL